MLVLPGAKSSTIFIAVSAHGEKGDGGGYLVRDNGGKYPAQPANLIDSQFVYATNGRYYHTLMYGRNAMGSYADKLSLEQ